MPITYKNSRAVGNTGEAIALAEFVKIGLCVFMPFGQNTPIDLMVFSKDRFWKIQVKTTQKVKNGVMYFDMCRTNGFTFEKTPYTDKDTDYFFLYCIENGYKGLISIKDVLNTTELSLRIENPKNNQRKKIRFAHEYIFNEKIKEIS